MLLVACFGVANAQDTPPEPPMKKPMAHMDRENFMAKLKLTDDQKKQMKDLKFETDKKAIDLRSKLAMSKLELGKLLSSDAPDKDAIEKKINEVASNEAAVHTNRLDGWFEANKILTPEQQKEWRQVLRNAAMEQMESEHSERMEHRHRP
jgi:Spy/CpxP family protein refolding chaperone